MTGCYIPHTDSALWLMLVPFFTRTPDGPVWSGWWCWGEYPGRVVRPRA